jgi:hypothetical protein
MWCFDWATTEDLQEDYEKYGKLSRDTALGDTYRSLCKDKHEAIGKELEKRKAALPSD